VVVVEYGGETRFVIVCSQAKVAKACLRLDSVNVTVVPDKVGNPNGMQINYEHEHHVRNLFVYAETPQVILHTLHVRWLLCPLWTAS